MICTFLHLGALVVGVFSSTAPSPPPTTGAGGGLCRVFNSGRSADCLGRQLERVPWPHLPSSLVEVDLSYNRLQVIRAEDFARFPHLLRLNLKYNNISHLDSDAFRNNPKLEILDIFNNSLLEIPVAALAPLLNLKRLYMSNNLYKRATLAETFSTFVGLQTLSLGGPLVEGLRKEDFQPLKNIQLQEFAVKCSSNLLYYEPGSLKVVQTQKLGFDMAIDQQPGVLVDMLRDIANKTFRDIQFRNLFEFMYYTDEKDIFQGLGRVRASQLIFHRGKFNENLLRMALLNLKDINRLRLQYIDFARSPTFVDDGAASSITDLDLDTLDLW